MGGSGVTSDGGNLGGSTNTSGSGTGGATGAGGSLGDGGTAGASASGGTAGEQGSGGVAAAGGGGTDSGAGSGGTGDDSGGSGGTGGGASSGGTGGDDGGGGGTGGIRELTPEGIVGLDGRLITVPCCGQPTTDDCDSCGPYVDGVANPCLGGQSDLSVDHPVGGTQGAVYAVTLHFYGIMEPKNYGDEVERDAAPDAPDRDGADPTPWAVGSPGMSVPGSNFNTYEIHVLDQNREEVGVYFLNADTDEGHFTYVIDYERTIEVVGGGVVRLRSFDANCRIMKNCGSSGGYPCAQRARVLDVSGADPAPSEEELDQPGLLKGDDHGGQWWLIDVLGVEAL